MNSNVLKKFMIGGTMLLCGLFWFLSSVTVVAGLYPLRFGGMRMNGGLVIVPFIAGIIWLFSNFKSIGAKILTGIGVILIFASIIAGTQFIFHRTSLYSYLLMLVFIFGGLALVLQGLFQHGIKKKK